MFCGRGLLSVLFAAVTIAGCSSDRPATEVPKASASPDCVRGEPEALLSSQSEFRRVSAGEATESVQTRTPIRLTIRHFGCAHFALDFEFRWDQSAIPEPKYSLAQAADILDGLPVKESNKQAVKNLTAALRKMAKEPYRQPLSMSESETLTATTPSASVLQIRYDVAL